MLTLFRLSQRRLPALIAIMAMMMLFIAPVVSKTLAHWRVAETGDIAGERMAAMPGMVMNDAHMDGMAMDGHDMHAMPSAQGAQPSGHHNQGEHPVQAMDEGMMDDVACGYCQLLVHFPLLIWVFVPFIWLMLLISRAPSPFSLPFYLCIAFFGLPQPRAPPVL